MKVIPVVISALGIVPRDLEKVMEELGIKKREKIDKYSDIARGLEKLGEHEGDSDTNCNWCTWNGPQKPGKSTGGTGNQKGKAKKIDKYSDLARELKHQRDQEGDSDTNCNWCTWNGHQIPRKSTGGTGN